MKVVVTGADGFLGWHLRCRLAALTDHEVVPVGRAEFGELDRLAADADAIVHLAGVNRDTDHELVAGNLRLAQDVSRAANSARVAPRLIYANSIQTGNGTPYGSGKLAAAAELAKTATQLGADFVEVRLPNLFGEHGRPHYNSFVATFVDAVVTHRQPQVDDREINLLHAQGAAQALIEALTAPTGVIEPAGQASTVGAVWASLREFHGTYGVAGEIPALGSAFEVDLFNTYRARLMPGQFPMALEPRLDARGRLVETVRTHGRGGQTFVSTTVPRATRGDHFHLTKFERFIVVEGTATIRLRRLFSDEVISFEVDGAVPVAVDMPTMWAHNITNTSSAPLTTVFWTDTLFDPANPDTYPQPVERN